MKLDLYNEQADSTLKARWVAALRSGEYKQGKNSLRFNNKFCCLGVLCDIIDSAKWNLPWKSLYDMVEKRMANDHTSKLIQMNDRGSSFKEIADYIEANVHVAE